MLCHQLYTIQSLAAEGCGGTAEVRLLPDSAIYAAHFRGMPVTPGACLVQMACELASRIAGRSLDVTEASDIRFLHAILPGEIQELQFRFECNPDTDQWMVQVFSGELLCARMKMTLKA